MAPTLWQDLRAEDFDARIPATLFDVPPHWHDRRAAELLAEPGSLFAEPIGVEDLDDNAAVAELCRRCGQTEPVGFHQSGAHGSQRSQRWHKFQRPAAAVHWFVVACSASKLTRPAPAWELYTGSLFSHTYRAATAAAAASGGRVLILSAAHGLVEPERELAPYDVKLTSIAAKGYATAARQLAEYGLKGGDVVHAMLPAAYRELLESALGDAAGVEYVNEYAGARGVGDMRRRNWEMQTEAGARQHG